MFTTRSRPQLLLMNDAVLDFAPTLPEEFELLPPSAQDLRGVRALLAIGFEEMGRVLFDRAPDLELIATVATGADGLDRPLAQARGIVVRNGSGAVSEDVADWALGAMIALRREFQDADAYVRSGRWVAEGHWPMGRSLAEERVGIVGMGTIGRAIARRCAACRQEVRWWGPREKPEIPLERAASLHALAEYATVLFVACPGGPETRGLVDREVISRLGPDGLLVSVGRGSVIDQEALFEALRSGSLGQAALDVFQAEPVHIGEAFPPSRLLLSPHCAGTTRYAVRTQARDAIDVIKRFMRGEAV